MSQAWLAVLVPVALMTATIGMQRLEHRLLGPNPSTEDDHTLGRGTRIGRDATGLRRPG